MKKIFLPLLFLLSLMYSKELITPIPIDHEINLKKANLGKKLFFEKKLSNDNTVSCASCHIIEDGGDDNKQYSTGIDKKIGGINAPTVLNSWFNFVQFWDGRAESLHEQAKGPITNPIEMNSNFNDVINKLQNIPLYQKSFQLIFEDGITQENIVDSIAEFEKQLTTPNSRFDLFLKGKQDALSTKEQQGYKLFKSSGCISCHNGVNIGGNLYQKMGIMKKYEVENMNLGKYNITKKHSDKYYYKVPSLRNINLTAPYLHTGKAKDLDSAVKVMFEYQLGMNAKDEEIDKIVAFLKTLSGEIPKFADNQ